MIPWLDPTKPVVFPSTKLSLNEPNGLLAAGGQLNTVWLLAAYSQGIFPWFSNDEPILWWSPAPRTVFIPDMIHKSKSLSKKMRQLNYEIRSDHNFNDVINFCSEPRNDQNGTWITEEMKQAYQQLHTDGHAHSWEFYLDGQLLGGLYGVAIGRVFFGESMFSRYDNASKIALIHLVESGLYDMIDCQLPTDHLKSLGAIELSREDFEKKLKQYCRS